MSENLGSRIEALEAEVKRLRELVESIKIEDVEGDVSIHFGASADGVSIFVGDVEGDVSTGVSAGANGLKLNAGDIEGDLAIGITGPVNGAVINTGDVNGDISCSGGQVEVKAGGEGERTEMA